MSNLISINEAVSNGVDRVRRHIWINELDHLKLDIIDGRTGPWVHLYAPFNKECNGRDPVSRPSFEIDKDVKEWLVYAGPLPDSDKYKAAQKVFEGCLK